MICKGINSVETIVFLIRTMKFGSIRSSKFGSIRTCDVWIDPNKQGQITILSIILRSAGSRKEFLTRFWPMIGKTINDATQIFIKEQKLNIFL